MEELKKALADLAVQMVKNSELQSRLDAANTENEKLKKAQTEAQSRLDAVTAERDAAKETAEKERKARLDADSIRMDAARARIKLEEVAGRYLRNDAGESDDVSNKSDNEIRTAVIEKITGKSMEGKSEAYVSARFDAALEMDADGEAALANVNGAVNHPDARADGTSEVEKARAAWLKREQTRYDNLGKKGA